MKGRIFVFSGPSGAGKTTIIHRVRERIKDVYYSVSHTSRSLREGEKNGVDYYFVDKGTFKKMIEQGDFIEWATVYSDLYGTSYSSLMDYIKKGLDVILDVDSQGAKNIKDHFKECLLTYILPPSMGILEKRLRGRASDDPEVINSRTRKAREELKSCTFYDYYIINDDLENAVAEAEAIILSDRCSKERALPRIKERFDCC